MYYTHHTTSKKLYGAFTLMFLCINITHQQLSTYKAAVVEYATEIDKLDSPIDILSKNVKKYEELIQEASKKQANIIVFPEDGLTGLEATNFAPEHIKSYTVPTVTLYSTPCTEAADQVLRNLSCAARDFKIYVVVNLIERKDINQTESNYYNTNLVFDTKGALIARFHKMNLYYEPTFKPGTEITTFKTDFNVTFGMFICFDILFKNPSVNILNNPEVTDVVYSTAWFSELPHFAALSVQAGYARGHGVNFLASGLNKPSNKNGGSGIYLANGTIAEAYISGQFGTKLIVQDVPIISKRVSPKQCSPNTVPSNLDPSVSENIDQFSTYREDLTNFTLEDIDMDSGVTEKTVCSSGGFCCDFNIKVNFPSDTNTYQYKMAVYNGVRHLGPVKAGIRTCSLIACPSADKSTCGKVNPNLQPLHFNLVNVTGVFDEHDVFDMPSTLKANLTPLNNYVYCKKVQSNGKVKIVVAVTDEEVISFGFYGRVYESDGYVAGYISNTSIHSSLSWLITVVTGVITLSVFAIALMLYVRHTQTKSKSF